jgi:UDP-2,3-diacylglucosamine hydrolase
VADAHLGATPPVVEEMMLAFLDRVPTLGDSLLVNGDLFDFWFEYRRVIPRINFHIVAALAALRRKVPILMVGGNHDRWGGDFWRKDLGIDFHPKSTRFTVGERQVLAVHGDGLTEQHWSATMMHHLTSNRLVVGAFRAMHPAMGFWLADRMSHKLGNSTRDAAVLDRAAVKQKEWAETRLRDSPELGLVVMGHTHRPALTEPQPGRQYLNSGAWLDGFCYAVATSRTAELRRFTQ